MRCSRWRRRPAHWRSRRPRRASPTRSKGWWWHVDPQAPGVRPSLLPEGATASLGAARQESDMKHAVKHIHFVGIGGAGMSGIAEILHNLGYTVSGSDQSDSVTSRRLASLGIKVAVGHAAAHVTGAEAVVTSTAVRGDNPEVIAARSQRIPVVPRAVMLAELM